MHKKTNLILPFVLSAAMVLSPVVTSVPVLADDAQVEAADDQNTDNQTTDDQTEASTDESADAEDGEEEVKTHAITVTATMADGSVSGMYAMENAIVTEQSDGTYLVRMHQSSVNRNLLALTDDKDKATNHEVDWYQGAGDDGYWFVIPVLDLNDPLYGCMCSTTRVSQGKAFGNIITFTFDTSSMTDTTEAEVTTDELNILPAETPEPETVVQQLTASSTTAMFKAVSGYVETTDGQSVLHVALSGTGCQDLYPGTYEEAAASTDADPVDTSNWIHYTVNDDGKYEFAIPIEEGQTYVPVVSLSGKYYTSGSKIWYPRQFVIDYENSTLVSGDYDYTYDITLNNSDETFPASSAAMEIIAGPKSNNYKQILKLTMSDASYDKAYLGTAAEAAAAETTIALDENNTFAITMMANVQGGTVDYDYLEQEVSVSFHNADTDTWTEGVMTVSRANGTADITVPSVKAPVITEQPADVTASIGKKASFSVTAENAASYQWYYSKDGKKWYRSTAAGSDTDTVSITVNSKNSGHSYRCKVTGTDGTTVTSEAASIILKSGVVITAQPESVEASAGDTITYSVKAENAVSYQWYYSKDGVKWYKSTASGSNTDTITLKVTKNNAGHQYRCKITGEDGKTVTSDIAKILS